MILAADIGNSNIVLGLWDDATWRASLRVETHPVIEMRKYRKLIEELAANEDIEFSAVPMAIISSVVPSVTQPFVQALLGLVPNPPLILNAQTDTGITLATEHPEQVGADLIADAAGAFALVQNTCIVVDFGTATTIMAVKNPGKLIGGAICTGLKVSLEALVGKTAQLPQIPLEVPASSIGRNTIETMQSGLLLGHLSMVEGLIDRMKDEIGPAKVVATGGLVTLLAPHTKHFNYVKPMLTLDGLRLIAEREANGKSEMRNG